MRGRGGGAMLHLLNCQQSGGSSEEGYNWGVPERLRRGPDGPRRAQGVLKRCPNEPCVTQVMLNTIFRCSLDMSITFIVQSESSVCCRRLVSKAAGSSVPGVVA